MPVFNKYINNCSKLDWSILINGSILMYYQESVLEKDVQWFKNEGYQVFLQECSSLNSEKDFHEVIKDLLKFPEYYGENIPALSDCLLHDLPINDEEKIVLILKSFNDFYVKNPDFSNILLSVLDLSSRQHLLVGERFIVILQTNNVDFKVKPLERNLVRWNRKESAIDK